MINVISTCSPGADPMGEWGHPQAQYPAPALAHTLGSHHAAHQCEAGFELRFASSVLRYH